MEDFDSLELACDASRPFAESRFLRAAELTNCVFSVLGLGFCAQLLRRRQRFPVHVNFKVICANIYMTILVQMASNLVSSLYVLGKAQWKPGHCAQVYTALEVAIFKWPMVWTIPTVALLHLSVFVERCLASYYKDSYEQMDGRMGVGAAVCVWLLTLLINAYIYSGASFATYLPYCMAAYGLAQVRMLQMSYGVLVIEVAVTAGDLLLQVTNRIKCRVFSNYSLAKSYQMQENNLTARLVFPVALVHSLVYAFYLAGSMVWRLVSMSTNDQVSPTVAALFIHNLLLSALVAAMAVYIQRTRVLEAERSPHAANLGKRSATDMYFELLAQQFS